MPLMYYGNYVGEWYYGNYGNYVGEWFFSRDKQTEVEVKYYIV